MGYNPIVAESERRYDSAARVGNALARADALVADRRKKAFLTGTAGIDRYLDHLALRFPQLFMRLYASLIAQAHRAGVQDDIEVGYSTLDEFRAALSEQGVNLPIDVIMQARASQRLKLRTNDGGAPQTNGISGKDAQRGRLSSGTPFGNWRKAGSHHLIIVEMKQRCHDSAVRVGDALARADALVTDKRKRALLTGTAGMDRYIDHLALQFPQLFMHEWFAKWVAQVHKEDVRNKRGVQDNVEVRYETLDEACASLRECGIDPDVILEALEPKFTVLHPGLERGR
jgi:hypothetical protein